MFVQQRCSLLKLTCKYSVNEGPLDRTSPRGRTGQALHAGVGRTGVFITLSIVLERMRYEGVVDIFQTVKMLRTQRPAMVQTEDEYQFCYHAALEYLGSFDHYAT
ncbi:Receptor-type tyrosine-protein phosphatase S [Takifugu flavidus]|uniref:protein-tyrosine-phosphatase n=1 Tax=Takifugu flavidus TaxID=433684 RepID=A0A5C6MS00_9TELE|nr:Receptor-type tyrosine-protein phosphatase S [Takifugu flavidus]